MKKSLAAFFLALTVLTLSSCEKEASIDMFIHFNTQGDYEIESIQFDAPTIVKAPMTPIKEGYIFEGWYTDDAYLNVFNFEDSFIEETTTLYAKWREQSTNFKQTFKILSIGNSFSEDTHWHLWQVARSYGIDVDQIIVANMYIGGAPLSTHRTYLASDAAVYRYEKYTGPIRTETMNAKLSDAIKDEAWDVITFQESSNLSGQSQHIEDTITVLASWAKSESTNPNVQIAWHMTWAYQQNSTHSGFAFYNHDQMTMLNSIIEMTQEKVFSNPYINFVIPTGIAIQNARTSFLGDTLTMDGHHLSNPHGRYIGSLIVFKAITNFDVSEETITYAPQGITAFDKMAIFEAVNQAFENRFKVTESIFST